MTADTHMAQARRRLEVRAQERAERHEAMRRQAVQEAAAIVEMIAAKYHPLRIYQWGSVLRPGGFRDYSDVDIAVEGIDDAQAFFQMLAEAQTLTRRPVDLVQVDKVVPE